MFFTLHLYDNSLAHLTLYSYVLTYAFFANKQINPKDVFVKREDFVLLKFLFLRGRGILYCYPLIRNRNLFYRGRWWIFSFFSIIKMCHTKQWKMSYMENQNNFSLNYRILLWHNCTLIFSTVVLLSFKFHEVHSCMISCLFNTTPTPKISHCVFVLHRPPLYSQHCWNFYPKKKKKSLKTLRRY